MAVSLRERRCVVVLSGDQADDDGAARALARSLSAVGVDVRYMGREDDAVRIVASVTDAQADAVEVCLAGAGGIRVLRELLRELNRADRGHVTVVVHRVH